jgi:hypothetical protein
VIFGNFNRRITERDGGPLFFSERGLGVGLHSDSSPIMIGGPEIVSYDHLKTQTIINNFFPFSFSLLNGAEDDGWLGRGMDEDGSFREGRYAE